MQIIKLSFDFPGALLHNVFIGLNRGEGEDPTEIVHVNLVRKSEFPHT